MSKQLNFQLYDTELDYEAEMPIMFYGQAYELEELIVAVKELVEINYPSVKLEEK